jgi:hypothetical protein
VAGVGDERAPVSGKVVLWLKAEVREVAAARCQSGEGESWRGGERTRLAAMRFPFKGGGGGVAMEGGWSGGARPSRGGSGGEQGGLGAQPRDSGGRRGRGDVGRRG